MSLSLSRCVAWLVVLAAACLGACGGDGTPDGGSVDPTRSMTRGRDASADTRDALGSPDARALPVDGSVPIAPDAETRDATPADPPDAALPPPPLVGMDIRAFGARCDGATDDAAAVQAAIDATPNGGTVIVSCMASIGSAGVALRDRANVHVIGVSGGGFRAIAPTHQSVEGFNSSTLVMENCAGCELATLRFDGNHVNTSALGVGHCNGATVRDSVIVDVGLSDPGITAPGDGPNGALVAVGNHGNQYLRNTVTNTARWSDDGTRGMWIGNHWDTAQEWNPVITGNTVRNAGATGIGTHAIGAVVTDNLVEDTQGSGIKLVPPPAAVGSRVEGNTLRRNHFQGVQIENGQVPIVVRGNTIEDSDDRGILSSGGPLVDAQIVDNTVRGNRQSGVLLYEATERVVMRGNRFGPNPATGRTQDLGVAIELYTGSVGGVQITENRFEGHGYDGVHVYGRGGAVTGLEISANAFVANGGYGVYLEETAAGAIQTVALSGNCFAGAMRGTLLDDRAAGRALAAPTASSSCP